MHYAVLGNTCAYVTSVASVKSFIVWMLKMTDVGLDFADADLNLSFGPEGTNVATVSGREYQLLVSLV